MSGGYGGGHDGRYPMWNSTDDEAARLGKLQGLHDDASVRRLRALGVGPGWDCLELGAGAGSMATWMADEVGATGTVTAVDRDTSQLQRLGQRPGVAVVEDDLTTMAFAEASFDVIHSRSVLMHVETADDVVARLVPALRPGGVVLFEEADGAPATTAVDPPAPFVAVMVPLARRWTWARHLPDLLDRLGMEDVHDDRRDGPLTGGDAVGAFWQHTLRSIRVFLTDPERMASAGAAVMDDATIDAMLDLLDDPDFVMPFALRHNVSGRRPGARRPPSP
ncbi:MAG TPA: class I SAM-dependent methyltransferase [Acidimicrobiales bacterium]|nr:class I SAM-dependent methyltransferase [Acidimicrobiales bacterium]